MASGILRLALAAGSAACVAFAAPAGAQTVSSAAAQTFAAVELSNDDGATWVYTPASASCGAPAGHDSCVTGIRWCLLTDLSSVAPDNTGSVQFIARIP